MKTRTGRRPMPHRSPVACQALVLWIAACGSPGPKTGDERSIDVGRTADAAGVDGAGGPAGGDATRPGRLRDEVKAMMARSSCPAEPCPRVTVSPSPARLDPRSRGQRILLIDDGLVTQGATRYQSRVLAFVRREGDGRSTSSPVTPQHTPATLDVDNALSFWQLA